VAPSRHVRDELPLEVRVALLEQAVAQLQERFDTLFKAIVGLIATLLSGMLLFLFSVASGWIGGG
jgi:hypothetical protein